MRLGFFRLDYGVVKRYVIREWNEALASP